jgi:hypothetical protein
VVDFTLEECIFHFSGGQMMDEYEEVPRTLRDRVSERTRQLGRTADRRANSMEARYLSILRYSLLVIATLLALFAIWSLGFGLIRQIGSTQVQPRHFEIEKADVAPAPVSSAAKDDPVDAVENDHKFAISSELRKATLQAYRTYFARYERKGEETSAAEVMDAVWPQERREAFDAVAADGLVTGPDGKAVTGGEQLALMAVQTVGNSAAEPSFKAALQSYSGAKKVKVCEYQTRTRKRTISTWDDYSTSCTGWYNYPYGCPSTRTVEEPYTENVCEMKFPSDLEAPHQAMGTAVQRYLDLATSKTAQARNDASAEEGEIAARKLRGREGILLAGQVFLGFLAVMLVYLFVALERHHRVLRRLLPSEETVPEK